MKNNFVIYLYRKGPVEIVSDYIIEIAHSIYRFSLHGVSYRIEAYGVFFIESRHNRGR